MVVDYGAVWRWLIAVDQLLVVHITVVKNTQSVPSTGQMPNEIWDHHTPSLGNHYLLIDSVSVGEWHHEATELAKVR